MRSGPSLAALGVALPVAALMASCGADHASKAQPCSPRPLQTTTAPSWTASAGMAGPSPYIEATGDPIVGFFFAPRLRVGHPSPANKVLWVVGRPRQGKPLVVEARQGGAAAPVVMQIPANAYPGEIHPSYVDLPRAGCWRLNLAWGQDHATIDVAVSKS